MVVFVFSYALKGTFIAFQLVKHPFRNTVKGENFVKEDIKCVGMEGDSCLLSWNLHGCTTNFPGSVFNLKIFVMIKAFM